MYKFIPHNNSVKICKVGRGGKLEEVAYCGSYIQGPDNKASLHMRILTGEIAPHKKAGLSALFDKMKDDQERLTLLNQSKQLFLSHLEEELNNPSSGTAQPFEAPEMSYYFEIEAVSWNEVGDTGSQIYQNGIEKSLPLAVRDYSGFRIYHPEGGLLLEICTKKDEHGEEFEKAIVNVIEKLSKPDIDFERLFNLNPNPQ